MSLPFAQLLLADDDTDDCILFKDALDELHLHADLVTVNDGEQLMQMLTKNVNNLPTVLFLDLNMPRKNGFECLTEIKRNDKLKQLPVIIYSTSLEPEMVNNLYNRGAQHYIRKPSDFSKLKQVIRHAFDLTINKTAAQRRKEDFVIQP